MLSIQRVDSFIQKNAKNYTAASLQKYKETGDLSVLDPLGKPVHLLLLVTR